MAVTEPADVRDVLGPTAELPVAGGQDVVRVRHKVRELAVEVRLSLVDQTKLVTAASELARNILVHAGTGVVQLQSVQRDHRKGVRAVFIDTGPGIADIPRAMADGWTTGSGLGLGLGGSRRLVDEFYINSEVGTGTTVTVVKWIR